MTPRRELVEPNAPLSMRWQCELLGVNRSSLYYEPVEPDGEQLALMRRMDELHLKHPFFGSRMMTQILKAEGSAVNRKRVQRLMRLMGLESTAPKPNTSKPAPEHTVYPYLLRNLTVSRINQVWAADITRLASRWSRKARADLSSKSSTFSLSTGLPACWETKRRKSLRQFR